jgi:uroporphyrinogen-III synthase
VKPLLILRPEPGASRTADRAKALGLNPIIRPLFEIVPRAWDAPDPSQFDAIVLTSANAAIHAGYSLTKYAHLRAFVVGAATELAVRATGFRDIATGHGNSASLLHMLAQAGFTRPLHLAGEDHVPYPSLPFTLTTRIVYASVPVPVALPDQPCVALLHSARAAQRFAAVCQARTTTDIVTISREVADAAGTGWYRVMPADAPNDDAMLALAAPLCKSGGNAA